MFHIAHVGTVNGTAHNGGLRGELTIPLAPIDQDARFIVEVLGGHDHQGVFVGARHIVITGSYGEGGVVGNEIEYNCGRVDEGGVRMPIGCQADRVSTRVHDDDGDGFVDLTITNGEENRLEGVIVIVRGVGELLPFGQ